VIIEPTPAGLTAHPVDGRIRLWDDSLAEVAPGQSSSTFHGKAEVVCELATSPAPLRAIYIADGSGTSVSIERLSRRDALMSLASHGYRLDPTSRPLLEREVAFFELIAANVPVSTLRYPRGFNRLEEVHAAIGRDLDAST